ncbi:FkbM family methyltransferase [Pseudooceanicola sp. C21-150M6]|uniref:FkbM family methyltransferase n=1 Tax=Pseudooceanicola sp. C21-150M6 TaxID=3434355 RepID=UPI003D7FF082
MDTQTQHQDEQVITSRGVRIPVDLPGLTPRLMDFLRADDYETRESEAVLKIVRRGDRVVDLGAGIGYLSALMVQRCKPRIVHAIEANPNLIPGIARVMEANNITNVVIENAILGPAEAEVNFYVRRSFVASSLLPEPAGSVTEVVKVPMKPARETFAALQADVLVCDIEGAEVDLIPRLDLTGLRAAVVELHPQNIGLKGVGRVFDAMSQAGLIYNPRRSNAKVVTFSRPE